MQKRNIDFLRIIVTPLVICFVFFSCKQNISSESSSYSLECVYYTKFIQKPIEFNVSYSKDFINTELRYKKNGKSILRKKYYKFINYAYYELKVNKHFEDEISDTIYVISFYPRDTSFNYEFNYEKYFSNLPRGYDDWTYRIRKINRNLFSLTKKHLKDTTFKEEYYFDNDFIITGVDIYEAADTLMFKRKY